MRTDGAPTPFVWRDKGYLACSHGVARLYILFLARLLTRLKPSSVLEVGAGNGQNLFVLSALFPEISFTGVELTEGGVESARAVLLEPRLPEIVARFAPEPVADLATPANLSIERGNAAQLDFEDGAFDLVYTVLALEQMEEIRDRALSEVSRVAGKYAVLIEPFRDWNDRGIRRDYVYANDYFSARIDDLSSYGLKPLCAWSDFPTKVRLGSGVVVAEKMTGRSES
jgi:ubiquinone/menaquinone biosynthesis C-methylase UbiE